ncbi:negative transcriptional regulator, PaiB family [Enhydrobacter aerosaccus]|uniref:Negative transcriptional regulator, PaiB family n=1 Tax=Enhydrobacter aerosaccus TaxID=225324 RepID=A0A1T4PBU7_9HYPH|nr:FMN-binding negative transcriptional regulator [Enhydrobacter aerosaccus]SJZ88994.1 negative transcriptional regulator, PaiB family [Enhydrobacter aerosaccus]
MYIPKLFEVSEATGREIMQAHSWALLISTGDTGAPVASHLALLWQDDGSAHGHLIGHMARANPHWKLFGGAAESMVMFWGPHAYVSPTWYAPGPKVPTWNYVTVHAYGRPEIVDDTKGALDVLARLAAAYEGTGPEAWTLDRLPAGNAEAQTKGIVAFRMPLTRIEAKAKLSQNRDLEDRHRVIARLEASDSQDAQATALWMKKVLP